MFVILFLLSVVSVYGGPPPTESFKDQYCTDPRTMKKHAAYTEWADAYSCTRHRCQPGGRNLAIYTVGCKRVEAPESAIECEEVVEDTNMQFPFCCTRLRCLVVVRGEVWTRVLGQPWESLPAAPWSHMYKMKKPPPGDTTFLPKSPGEGPVYELSSDVTTNENAEKLREMRAGKKTPPENADCNEVVPRSSVPTPDIVIALSTANEPKENKKPENRERYKRGRKLQSNPFLDEDNLDQPQQQQQHNNEIEVEDTGVEKEKPTEGGSEEKYITNSYGVTQKSLKASQRHQSWTEIPPNIWSDHEGPNPITEVDTTIRDGSHPSDLGNTEEKHDDKPSNLQALVDAIGTRMRDIENVVQKMSEKVHKVKPEPGNGEYSGEKKSLTDAEVLALQQVRKHHNKEIRTKRPNPEGDQYKRFSVRNRGSKYLHTTDITTEVPVFIEDNNMNGYFSDASNNVLRRSSQPKKSVKSKNVMRIGQKVLAQLTASDTDSDTHIARVCRAANHTHLTSNNTYIAHTCSGVNHTYPKEPAAIYMAPVENKHKAPHIVVTETSDEAAAEKKHKKHSHKKKKNKGKNHKKHHKDEKKKHANKLSSVELEKNVVSLEDSSGVASN